MRLTQKILGYLHKVFDKDPHKFLAIRLQYQGGMTWQVADGILTTTVTGGQGQNLTIDLSQYTVAQLVAYLLTQRGYFVLYADTTALSSLKATVLMDGSNDQALSNGDHLYGYTNVLWSYAESQANELEQAQVQIGEMLKQMSTTTASGEWLDLLGGYYGIPRLQGEIDAKYGPRIIAEVLRPRGNNVAIELAIQAYTGQVATVTDVTLYGPTAPLYNGAITRNSASTYSASAKPIYGLFDVTYGYDLINGGDISAFTQIVKDLINRLRDAGTQMRSLLLAGSALSDTLTPPADGDLALSIDLPLSDTLTAPTDDNSSSSVVLVPFSDPFTAPMDFETLTITYNYQYNSIRRYDGSIFRVGGMTVVEPL